MTIAEDEIQGMEKALEDKAHLVPYCGGYDKILTTGEVMDIIRNFAKEHKEEIK